MEEAEGISAKVGAGFCITTGFYLMFVLLYTFIVLFVLGVDGANCPIQLDLWRSVYNITFLQAYLFIVLGGYIGTIFAATLAMLVSALTRSTPTADYCTIHCVMCISIFKQNYYIAGIMLFLSRPVIRNLFGY